MLETLENILHRLCKTVEKSRETEHQAVYDLTDVKDAKLAYDVLASAGVEAKYFPQDNHAKIYVEKDSYPSHAAAVEAALASVDMLKQIKQVADGNPAAGQYTIAFTHTPLGKQLMIQFPHDRSGQTMAKAQQAAQKAPEVPAKATAAPTAGTAPTARGARRKRYMVKKQEDGILKGPSVARQALPKYMKSKEGEEDSLVKTAFLHTTGRAFKSGAGIMAILLILGVIFSIGVTIRGFLCPDFVTVTSRNPSYCPRVKTQAENALENRKAEEQ